MARRVRVDEQVAFAIAAVAGIAASLSSARPTGSTIVDVVLVVLAVGAVTWAGASAHWWALAIVAAVATAFAGNVVLLLVGTVAFVAALWIGLQRRDLAPQRAAVAALSTNVLIRAEFDAFLGALTLVGVACGGLLVVSGLPRRGLVARRSFLVVATAAGAFVAVAVGGFAVSAALAEDELRSGNDTAQEAISLLSDGDYAGAADEFEAAVASFESAAGRLDRPWARLAGAVPVVAQNRRAVVDLADTAAEASTAIGAALRLVDVDQLRLLGGRIDVDAVELLRGPFGDLERAIEGLEDTLDDVRSPWLLAAVTDRLDELDERLVEYEPRLATAVDAVEVVPRLLGADEARRYLVAFTTPAETRGLGGFMGNWIEFTAVEGRVRVSDSGRTKALNDGGDGPRMVSGPQDWLDVWGVYGFDNGPGGTTGRVPWSNITVSPQFPSTGQVMAELYPQSGGEPVDGVFAVDPYVLQAFLGFTGPISVEGVELRLTAENVVDFLLVDQYRIDGPERLDLLEEVSRTAFAELLVAGLPGPMEVARVLGPLTDEGRLVGWAADEQEQEFFDSVGLSGALPPLDGGDGLAVVLNNAGANKLDVYLERSVSYESVVDTSTGEVTATATVRLANGAPSAGLPDGVIGNYTGDDPGTNRVLVSLYSALPVRAARVSGPGDLDEPFSVDVGAEAGWTVGSAFFAIPPGDDITIMYELQGVLPLPDGYRVTTRPQPMVIDEMLTVSSVSTTGRSLVEFEGFSTVPGVVGLR